MRRRDFITGMVGSATAWPLAARAQQSQMRRVGVLMGFSDQDSEGQARLSAFRNELDKLGWSIHRNVILYTRWAASNPGQLNEIAAELVDQNPDVLIVSGTTQLLGLLRETRTIPIVFANVADPVASGLVASWSHPGGNFTGFTNYEATITGKWAEIIKEVAPNVTRILVLYYPANAAAAEQLRALEPAAKSLGLHVTMTGVRESNEIEHAIVDFGQQPNGALIVLPDANIGTHRERIVSVVNRSRLPAMYPLRYFVTSGGLMSYGVDPHDLMRRSASYVDRILKGAKPGELPIQAPTKFELIVNLRAAKALGLVIPETFLVRADEVIE